MADKYSGSELNRDLIKKLNESLNSIIEEGRQNAKAPDKSGLEKITLDNEEEGPIEDIYVSSKDQTAYNAIKYVKTVLDFGECELSQVYDLIGGSIKVGGTSSKFRLFLPTLEASSLVEKIISTKITEVLDIEFPQDFYRLNPYFKGDQAKLPDIDMEAPLPKKGNETNEEYEKRLEEEYKKHGIEKEADDGNKWRKPYPHERVNYKKELDNKDKKTEPGISKLEDTNQSGYYQSYVKEQQRTNGNHTEATAGRHKVKGARVSTVLGTGKNFIQNLLKGRLVNLGISKYLIAGASGAAISTLLLGGGVITGFTAAAVAAGFVKAIDMVRYGTKFKRKKPKTEPTPTEIEETPSTEETEEEELDLDLDELEAIRMTIEENLVQINNYASAYQVKREELAALNEDPEANKEAIEQHKTDMADILIRLQELSGLNESIMTDYMNSVNKKGRSL